jgi:SNF2 family DNA or RNA helicase
VELTGTPAPNSIQDLWAQLFLLDGGERLGRTISGFRSRYFDSNTHGGHFTTYSAKSDAQQAIQDKISDICISMKADDYLQLPDLVYDTVPVQLDNKAQKAYDQMERDLLLNIDESMIDAGSAVALSNKLLQICNGAVYDENRKVVEIHDCKLDAFSELLERLHGSPALVFYNFQHDRDRIIRLLGTSDMRVRVLQSPQDAEDWNNRKIDILLAHPASCAYGLNLQQGGNHIIWYGLNWSLELYQQANKRLHRQGQKAAVFVHQLVVADTRDDDVLEALSNKKSAQDALIDSLKVRIKKIKSKHTR